MVNSIAINQTTLNILAQEPNHNKAIIDYMPSSLEFQKLEDLRNLLFPLKDFITCLSSQKYTTLSLLFPMYFALTQGAIHSLSFKDKEIELLKDQCVQAIVFRFDELRNQHF